MGTETTGSTVNTIVSCSFSGNEIETVTADTVQTGEVYVLMVKFFEDLWLSVRGIIATKLV